MLDELIEIVVAIIVLVIGVAIALALIGADSEIAASLIGGVTEIGVYVVVIGVLVTIPVALLQQAGR